MDGETVKVKNLQKVEEALDKLSRELYSIEDKATFTCAVSASEIREPIVEFLVSVVGV